jgi:cbb3-type cytochrome oxidase maturation protein
MALGVWIIFGWMVLVALTGVIMFVWGWKRGQFKDIEAAKYKMLEDREPEAWPDPEGGKS